MKKINWVVCESCLGLGKKKRKNKSTNSVSNPIYINCKKCEGRGIVISETTANLEDNCFPHVAIIGLGIGGITLAVACMQRGIPFTIFERDSSFEMRSQGYGLTLQQANKTVKALGINHFEKGMISTRHLVHNTDGEIIASWGKRKWKPENSVDEPKQTNVHIARQELRKILLNQLNDENKILWNHKFLDFKSDYDGYRLNFLVDGSVEEFKADLIIGADGIRSSVRNQLLPENCKPLKYLGCIVVLGICTLDKLQYLNSDLFDSETVFQTANGNERIYVMPYSKNAVMWQLSFPFFEDDAIKLSKLGANALKTEALQRLKWHTPIPELIQHTEEKLITGYPVYDRVILESELSETKQNVTLIGDAAHPMSPFKGQGANQAMIDALSLARMIYSRCKYADFRKQNLRDLVLNDFEKEMIARTAIKVNDSAKAATFLHMIDVLSEKDQPRRKVKDEF